MLSIFLGISEEEKDLESFLVFGDLVIFLEGGEGVTYVFGARGFCGRWRRGRYA